MILISLGESATAIPVKQIGKLRPGEDNQLLKLLLGMIMAEESLKHRFFSYRRTLPVSLSPIPGKGDTLVMKAVVDGSPSLHVSLG